MKNATKNQKAEKAEKKADHLKAIAKTHFVLWHNKEYAIIKERSVDLGSPKNVLHVMNIENGSITGNYVETVNNCIDGKFRSLYSVNKRTGKGSYIINPIIAGILYHFCSRIQTKISMIKKSCKDPKIALQKMLSETRCDRINLGNFISDPLNSMIEKDFPNNDRSDIFNTYLSVDNVEAGKISFHSK